jgi:hypothetical protein
MALLPGYLMHLGTQLPSMQKTITRSEKPEMMLAFAIQALTQAMSKWQLQQLTPKAGRGPSCCHAALGCHQLIKNTRRSFSFRTLTPEGQNIRGLATRLQMMSLAAHTLHRIKMS